jgi:hypothetical protein
MALPPDHTPNVSIRRLPVTGSDLFGREAELAWLDQCWATGVHVATLVAWGGVGKSALGLLARAALHTHTRAFALARHDLDEALTIAQRCGLRLHEADAHLGLARLSLAEGAPDTARDHLAKARTIITATGYHRRDPDLAELTATLG